MSPRISDSNALYELRACPNQSRMLFHGSPLPGTTIINPYGLKMRPYCFSRIDSAFQLSVRHKLTKPISLHPEFASHCKCVLSQQDGGHTNHSAGDSETGTIKVEASPVHSQLLQIRATNAHFDVAIDFAQPVVDGLVTDMTR